MRAIRVEHTGGPEVLQLAEIEPPVAGPGEVLIRHTAIGVNYIDVYQRQGIYPLELPFVPGREGVGVVEAIGPDVVGFEQGMRVGYAEAPKLGGYAERNVVPARWCVEVPDRIDDATACAALLQGLTAHVLVNDAYRVSRGDRVLVHAAAGGVGRIIVQLAKARGAVVIATAGGPAKVALARSAGADHVIDYRAVDFEPEVRRITDGAGVDAVYDAVGKDTWERGLRSLCMRGTFVLYGASSGPVPPIDPRLLAAASLSLTRPGFIHFARTHDELTERATEVFDAIGSGTLEIRIAGRYPLADAAQAHRDLEGRATTGKLVLLPTA